MLPGACWCRRLRLSAPQEAPSAQAVGQGPRTPGSCLQVDQGAHEAELQSMRDHYERMHQANSMRRQRNLALEQQQVTLQTENADLCFQLQRAEVGGPRVNAVALP